MFNRALLNVSDTGQAIAPSDVILYLPMTSNFADQGYYNLSYYPLDGTHPVISNGWGKFAPSKTTSTSPPYGNVGVVSVFNHPSFNDITNTSKDYTIEFNMRIVGDGQTSNGQKLKVFPFSFVGIASQNLFAADGSQVLTQNGTIVELGTTFGSHTSPGGFGFGAGAGDSSNRGVATACTNDDPAPDAYFRRGIAMIPSGNYDTWGPYYIAIVKKAGIVSLFINGKKVNSRFGADEVGSGDQTPGSTWTYDSFKMDVRRGLTNPVMGGMFNTQNNDYGLFVGGSYVYSTYGYDDDLYLQHFRVTRNVARYSADFTPEPMYTV